MDPFSGYRSMAAHLLGEALLEMLDERRLQSRRRRANYFHTMRWLGAHWTGRRWEARSVDRGLISLEVVGECLDVDPEWVRDSVVAALQHLQYARTWPRRTGNFVQLTAEMARRFRRNRRRLKCHIVHFEHVTLPSLRKGVRAGSAMMLALLMGIGADEMVRKGLVRRPRKTPARNPFQRLPKKKVKGDVDFP